MKYSLSAAALFAAGVSADLCDLGSILSGGNWYCQEVTAITYTGVGGAGSYNRITSMDSNTGSCGSTPFQYSGSLAPLDQEWEHELIESGQKVSLHFRGPLNLKQFAAYTPSGSSSTSSSSKVRRSATERRHHAHGHKHAHLHKAREASPVEERQVGAWVTVTMDGQVVSWVNEWSGEATAAPAAPAAAAAATTPAAAPAAESTPAASSSSSKASSIGFGSGSTVGGWARQAYYDSESASSNGLTFLNHNGGQGSGVWDDKFGNSLSYSSTDGTTGASSAQVLEDTTLPSSAEVVIMTDSQCGADDSGDCGFFRPGSVAYHGFDGPAKAFLFEFGMPSSSEQSTGPFDPVNMPAIWMLNAQIPRTAQYPSDPDCSCWKSGCGEFDIFEVLTPGDWRAKSTLHGNIQGGDSDFFARPFDGTIKLGVVLYENNIHMKVLDNGTTFGESIAEAFLNEIISTTSSQGTGVSLFTFNQ